ncbi:hypothetical protein VP01_4933g1, partial [Puccinia sorghi]
HLFRLLVLISVIKPIIKELHELTNPFYLNTHTYPTGRKIELRLLPLIGDLGDTHKVAGFASHSANYFFSWCYAHRDNMAKLTLGKPRTCVESRYSELNRLSYRNPVQHFALGVMHSWMEGVLMHQFRESWGFKKLSVKAKRVRQGAGHNPSKRARFEPPTNDKASSSHLDEDNNQCDDVDEDDVELNQGPGGLFTELDMHFFRLALTEVILPTAVGCIQSQLGVSKFGKLKASEWYTLFVYVIALIVLELFPIHRQRFKDSYQKYNATSVTMKILPNHHYALHIPEQLKMWGSLGEVAEFTSERMFGKLCSIETNNQLDESMNLGLKYDRMVTGSSDEALHCLEAQLKQFLEIKWNKAISRMVGVKINKKPEGFELSQPNLIKKILSKSWDGISCQKVPFPEGFSSNFDPEESGTNQSEHLLVIGSLNYVSVSTQPNITYAVECLAKYSSRPSSVHWKALNHLISYLAER